MPDQHFYHVSKDHHIHKGRSEDCAHCRRHKRKKTNAAKLKSSGSSGGKKSAEVTNTGECLCGAKIRKVNVSGLCLKCLNKKRRVAKQKKAAVNAAKVGGPRYCKVDGCNRKLSKANTSGYCWKCFRKSDHWLQQRAHHSNWLSSAVFSKDVKNLRSEEAELDG